MNIKILLTEVEASGDLTRKQRDDLLREMTDEVAELVLRDNYLQTQAITVTHRLGARLSDRTARFIRELERHGRLDRRVEFLPDEETLAERIQQGTSFTRPEIAVLLSYAKMELYDELLASDLPDDRSLEDELVRYFPQPIQDRFPAQVATHRLRREIIATVVTNDIVNRVGITFLREVRERTGRLPADIARAYVISREIFGMRDLWQSIEALDSQMPASVQAAMLAECGRLIERGSVWFLRKTGEPLDILTEVATYGEGLRVFGEMIDNLLPENKLHRISEKASGFVSDGAPEELAASVARLPALWAGCDIVRIAGELDTEVGEVGEVYFEIGGRLGFASLRRAAALLPTDSAWDKLAVTAILDDLFSHQSELTRRVIEDADPARGTSRLDQWTESRRSQLAQTELLLNEIQSATAPNLSMLAVANRQLRSLSS